ncbi:type III polyketide synthase [Dyadobacter tibetensis]|uniref:type III polyketide synthase n=1 Tax=Dyadobacter tibetensis TaxID=1211851 RepID=UPI0004718D3E|nr:type III polyketide synthase [Dyadobacter tibetensis]
MSYISQISTAVPANCYSQKQLAEYYADLSSDPIHKRKLKVIAEKSGIDTRYSVLPDFSSNGNEAVLFSKDKGTAGLSDRMSVFQKEAIGLSLQAIKGLSDFDEQKNTLTHLITVTCTGLFAPGLDIELIRALELAPNIHRTSINFMGCNAAILALKQADQICRSMENAKVLVVCTELCTLHFQPRFDDDYLLSNLLFADGAAAVIISSNSESKYAVTAKMGDFHSMILHSGYQDMAWQLSEQGFLMNLSSYVPRLIKDNMKEMMNLIGLECGSVDHWAVHPGGKKIVDDFRNALELESHQLSTSYEILRRYGNMSSPTVLFVLAEILSVSQTSQRGQRVFGAAFGPGISIETLQLTYV